MPIPSPNVMRLVVMSACISLATADEYMKSMDGLTKFTNMVIERSHARDRIGNVDSTLAVEIARINNDPPLPRRFRECGECKAWWYYGKIQSLNNATQDPPVVVLLSPRKYHWDGSSFPVLHPFGLNDDFFIVPQDNPQGIHLASVPKSLWFADFKKELPEFQKTMEEVKALPDEKMTAEILRLAREWNDIRGLAALEMLLDHKDVRASDIASLLADKSDDFQFKAAQMIMETKTLPRQSRFRIFDPEGDPAWTNGVKQLVKLLEYLLPEGARQEANAILKQIKDKEPVEAE